MVFPHYVNDINQSKQSNILKFGEFITTPLFEPLHIYIIGFTYTFSLNFLHDIVLGKTGQGKGEQQFMLAIDRLIFYAKWGKMLGIDLYISSF